MKTITPGANSAAVIDEDDMVSNSSTRPPSQQSVKAFTLEEGFLSVARHPTIYWEMASPSATGTSGSGANNITDGPAARVSSGTTAGSTAYQRWGAAQAFSAAGPVGQSFVRPFGSRGLFALNLNLSASTPNGKGFATYGNGLNDTNAAPDASDHSVGFQIDANALYGIAVDGSTISKVDLSTTMSLGVTYRLLAIWDGVGNVQFYSVAAGGTITLLGSTSGGSTAGNNSCSMIIGAANGADAANQSMDFACAITRFN